MEAQERRNSTARAATFSSNQVYIQYIHCKRVIIDLCMNTRVSISPEACPLAYMGTRVCIRKRVQNTAMHQTALSAQEEGLVCL